MTNIELAKHQLTRVLQDLENLSEEELQYYNSLAYDNGNTYYNAGITIGMFLGQGFLRGIVNNWKCMITTTNVQSTPIEEQNEEWEDLKI